MVDVTLIGTGGMMPLPERALTALYVRCAGRSLLIDCGEGTQTAMRRCGLRFKSIEGICITHFHADHISGLPGLLLTLGNEGRTLPLDIYGPIGLTQVVNSLRIIVPELPFEINCHEIGIENTVLHCAGFELTAFALNHGMPCLGYRMMLNRAGRFDPQKAKQLGIPLHLWGLLQKGESVQGFTPEDVLGVKRKGISILYATDTRPVDDIIVLGKKADLMILEGMFGDTAKQPRAEHTRHMTMQEAALAASKAQAKELWLTHYSPATDDPLVYLEELTAVFSHTTIAQDGESRTLYFENEA